MRARRIVAATALLLAALVVGDARGALRDPDHDGRAKDFKTALRPPAKGEAPQPAAAEVAIRAYAGTKDARVLKELLKAFGPVSKRLDVSREELDEVTEKLDQARQPYFEFVEEYYREHGNYPTAVLKILKESVDTWTKKQEEASALFDSWFRIHEALRSGLSTHLAALGDAREEVWKSAVKTGAVSRDPDVRAAFADALAEISGDDATEVLLAREKDENDPRVLVAVIESLARIRTRTVFERLKARLADPRWPVVVAAVHGLALHRDPETIPVLIDRLGTADGRVLADILETLFDVTGKHVPDSHASWVSWWTMHGEEFLVRWSQDKETRLKAIEDIGFADPKEIHVAAELAALLPTEPESDVRLEIIDSLAIHRSGYARETLLAALRDPDDELRLAAIRGLAHHRHLSVPPALMRRVDQAGEDELLAIFQALRTLWGGPEEFSVRRPDKDALHRWWDNNKHRVGNHLIQLGAKDIASGKREPKQVEGTWEDRNFYGLRILSKRVLFVFDVSLSMEEPAKKDGDRKKIDVARAELRRAISSLPEDAAFGMIAFSGTAELWEKGLSEASAAVKERALAWVDALQTRAATNIHDTLELCFEVGRQGARYEPGGTPDTLYFVSDGAPTAGKIIDPDRILAHVRRANEGRGLKIHCVGVGDDHDVDFLRKLAEENRGQYVAR